MEIKIRDYMGCERADITVGEGVTMIAGLNHVGKSSTIRAIQSLATATPLILGTKKGDAGALVRAGADKAVLHLVNGDASQSIELPSCELVGDGVVLASNVAAGVERWSRMSAKDRQASISTTLKAAPNRNDLAAEMTDLGFEADAIDKVAEQLRIDGFDATHKTYVERGQNLKGRWEQITKGGKYGSQKAVTWLPEAWEEWLPDESMQSLEAALTKAKEAHERVVGEKAVADAAAEAEADGESTKPDIPRMKELRDSLVKQVEDGELEISRLKHVSAGLRAKTESNIPCPWCSKPIRLRKVDDGVTQFEQGDDMSHAELEARRDKLFDNEHKLTALVRETNAHAKTLSDLKLEIAASERGAGKAAGKGDTVADALAVDDAYVNAARSAVDDAERRIHAFRTYHDALKAHESIVRNQIVIDILAPGGLRKKKLTRALDAFHGTVLHPLCDAAGWDRIEVDADCSIRFRGRGYAFCSDSERWRIDVVLQLAVATVEKADIVIMDSADINDVAGRNALFKLLGKIKTPSVVGITIPAGKEKAPDLAEAKIGRTYWMDGGIAAEL